MLYAIPPLGSLYSRDELTKPMVGKNPSGIYDLLFTSSTGILSPLGMFLMRYFKEYRQVHYSRAGRWNLWTVYITKIIQKGITNNHSPPNITRHLCAIREEVLNIGNLSGINHSSMHNL